VERVNWSGNPWFRGAVAGGERSSEGAKATVICHIFGLGRIELDGFLKAHGIYQEYTLEDFEQERQALKELGL
jgi:hypothetical protein